MNGGKRNLVVVGNGFDLAHELPTSYKYFKNYLDYRNDLSVLALENLFPKTTDKGLLLWSDFEEALAYPDENQLLELHELHNEFYENFTWHLDILRDTFAKWVEEICYSGTSQLDSSHPYFGFLKKDNVFLSFNYTETLEQTYGITNVLHIHGLPVHHDEGTGDCVIFGHKMIKTTNKYILSTEKPVKEMIKKYSYWFDNLRFCIDGNVVVLGFSYSEADRIYLKAIRNILSDKNWIFFYHTNDDFLKLEECIQMLDLPQDQYETKKC